MQFREPKSTSPTTISCRMFSYRSLAGTSTRRTQRRLHAPLSPNPRHGNISAPKPLSEKRCLAWTKTITYKVTAVVADPPPNTHLKFDILTLLGQPWFRQGPRCQYRMGLGRIFQLYPASAPAPTPPPGKKDRREWSTTNGATKCKRPMTGWCPPAAPARHPSLPRTICAKRRSTATAMDRLFPAHHRRFIIVIAWINYVNLATARSIDRAKEVGVRKVLGSLRRQLIHQFLFESLLINALAASWPS